MARKIIIPKKTQIHDVTVVPTLDILMNDALAIIGAELAHYRLKSKRGITLDLKEARAVQAYMDSLVKLSKENREQARADELESLSDDELYQLAKKAISGKPDEDE